jgi:hypothetical protein
VFTYDVVERGEIESSSNVDVRCEVQSRGGGGGGGVGGGAAIIEIVPEGTVVKAGDFLVKLDDSSLQSEHAADDCRQFSRPLIQSTAAVRARRSPKREYDRHVPERAAAKRSVCRRGKPARAGIRTLAKLSAGAHHARAVEADRFAVKARADLSVAKTN